MQYIKLKGTTEMSYHIIVKIMQFCTPNFEDNLSITFMLKMGYRFIVSESSCNYLPIPLIVNFEPYFLMYSCAALNSKADTY